MKPPLDPLQSFSYQTCNLHKFFDKNCIQGSAQKPLKVFSTKTSLMLYTIVRNLSTKKRVNNFFIKTGRGCAAAALRLWLLPDSDLPPIEMCGEKALNEHWQYITQVGNVTGVVYLAFFVVEVFCETANRNARTDCRNINFIKPVFTVQKFFFCKFH